MPTAAATADFAPKTLDCPTCEAACKRHSTYPRRIKDISLDGPVVHHVRVGNYWCNACGKFFKPELPFAGKGKRYTHRAVRKATVAVQEDKTTYTALPNRLVRDFAIHPSKSTGWTWFQEFAEQIDIESYLRWACGRFSGQISVDSIKDGNMHMWFATDPLNRDLILGYHRAENANSETLAAFLTALRDKYRIQPKLFTCDDANVFDSTPQTVWPGVPVQLCHFHVIKSLNYKRLRHSLTARIRKYKPVEPPKPRGRPRKDAAQERAARDRRRKPWVEMHRKCRLFFKSVASLQEPKSVEHEEAEFVEKCCNRYPAVREFRRFILDFYALMDCRDAAVAELLRRAFLQKWAGVGREDEHIAYVLKQFADNWWFGRLFSFAAFANGQHTTNSTERANRWFRKRQKTHYRCRKEHTIRRMLHADLIQRRGRVPAGEPPVRLRAGFTRKTA